MKKIFTLIAMAAMALSVNAQSERYGIYFDSTSMPGTILGVTELPDGTFGHGIATAGDVKVAYDNGKDTKTIPGLIAAFGIAMDFNNEFNTQGGNAIYDAYIAPNGSYTSTWSVMDNNLFVVTGYRNGTDETADGYVSSDDDASSRWPESEIPDDDNTKIDYTKKDLCTIAPDYWTGMTVEVPAGKTLNVEKITAAIATGNNMFWSINIFNEAGQMVYDSKVAQIYAGNSVDAAKQMWHMGYSADITATEVSEPLGGEYYTVGSYTAGPPPVKYDLDAYAGGKVLPLTAAKIDGLKAGLGWDPTGGKTPASKFQTLPEGGLKLTGKNTVRIYFCCKNSRVFGIGDLSLYGTLGEGGSTGIDNVVVENGANAPVYNVAGQIVGENYKGLVIKNGKKMVIK